jgi:hypothetical protein
MKIGKLGLASAILAALLMTQCKPKTANVEPVADTETESAVEAAWATYLIMDVEQLAAFVCDDELDNHPYMPVQNGTTYYEVTRDLAASQLVPTWKNGPLVCRDGRTRDGSVFFYTYLDTAANPDADRNSRYYRDYAFVGNISFQNYIVDGWEIKLQDPGNRGYVFNKRKKRTYQADEILTWRIGGKFLIKHPTDASKDITWEGEIFKELINSDDKDIWVPGGQKTINWLFTDSKTGKITKAANCRYYGSMFGTTGGNKPYKMEIKKETPLIRDFMCTADPVASVSAAGTGTAPFSYSVEEHHPIIGGIASFTTGTTAENKYPRQIYFGNEASEDQPRQCDYTGIVNIKGNYYPVNFRK